MWRLYNIYPGVKDLTLFVNHSGFCVKIFTVETAPIVLSNRNVNMGSLLDETFLKVRTVFHDSRTVWSFMGHHNLIMNHELHDLFPGTSGSPPMRFWGGWTLDIVQQIKGSWKPLNNLVNPNSKRYPNRNRTHFSNIT